MARHGFSRLPLPAAGLIDANGPLYGKWEGDKVAIGLEIENVTATRTPHDTAEC